MMQMLERAGIEPLTDGIRTADKDNPRGYYELEQVKQIAGDASFLERARGKAVKLISQLLLELPRHSPYRVVFMRRDLDEVLASQAKMLEHRGEAQEGTRDPVEMKQLFAAHIEEVESFLRGRDDIAVLFVSYNRLLADPETHTRRLARFLGPDGEPDERVEARAQAMRAAVDNTLYRNRNA